MSTAAAAAAAAEAVIVHLYKSGAMPCVAHSFPPPILEIVNMFDTHPALLVESIDEINP